MNEFMPKYVGWKSALPTWFLVWRIRSTRGLDTDAFRLVVQRGRHETIDAILRAVPHLYDFSGTARCLVTGLLEMGASPERLVFALIEILENAVSRPENEPVEHAAAALGQLGDHRANRVLLQHVRKFPCITRVAERALTTLGVSTELIVGAYIDALREAQPSYRRYWAAEILGTIGDSRALPELRSLLDKTPEYNDVIINNYDWTASFETQIPNEDFSKVACAIRAIESRAARDSESSTQQQAATSPRPTPPERQSS